MLGGAYREVNWQVAISVGERSYVVPEICVRGHKVSRQKAIFIVLQGGVR